MQFKQNELNHAKSVLVVTKAKTMEHGQFEAVLSTDDLDRHNEHVSIKGLAIPKGQVVKMYYNHETNGTSLPIGKWLKVWKSADGKLMGLGEVDLEDDFAVKVYKKILKGYIDSISIGFYPTEYDGDTSTWTKSTLVEASVVAEPANVNAVITSKQLGFTEEEFTKALTVKIATVKKGDDEDLFVGEPGTPPEEVVKNPATYGLVAPKKIDESLVKAFSAVMTKGGVADVLTQQDKWEVMEDFWDVVYAFSEAYYSPDAKVADFNSLLGECISILQTIVAGNYQYEDEEENTNDASGVSEIPEIKAAIEELKSNQGALEEAFKAANENPTTKSLIKVRLAQKQVDKTNEDLGKVLRLKLKETN